MLVCLSSRAVDSVSLGLGMLTGSGLEHVAGKTLTAWPATLSSQVPLLKGFTLSDSSHPHVMSHIFQIWSIYLSSEYIAHFCLLSSAV